MAMESGSMRMPGPGPMRLRLSAILFATSMVSSCYTEIGNPGKEQKVTARFRIDYTQDTTAVPKSSAAGVNAIPDSLRIQLFSLNVVEVNYTTLDDNQGRIWKVPDSLGKPVDFTGSDPEAVLPPVAVPPADYSILKLEARVPAHGTLMPDTLHFGRYAGGGYIKGIAYYPGNPIRFLCRFTDDYKINLVYTRDILEQWRQGDAYSFDFVFFAAKWLSAVDLTSITPVTGVDGPFVLIDPDHDPVRFAALRTSFFKSFNSSKVWKENPAP